MSDDAHQTTYAFVARAAMPEELAARFMDPNRPKTEAEHWAVREIEKQRAENDRLRAEIDGLEAELSLMKSGFEIAYRAMGDKP
jgi:hypothetical protein